MSVVILYEGVTIPLLNLQPGKTEALISGCLHVSLEKLLSQWLSSQLCLGNYQLPFLLLPVVKQSFPSIVVWISGSQPFFARGPLLSFIHRCGPTPHMV
jgi:hypothetical protein